MGSSSLTEAGHSWSRGRNLRGRAAAPLITLYQVTDLLHAGRTVRVPVNGIGPTVSACLADLGANRQVSGFGVCNETAESIMYPARRL